MACRALKQGTTPTVPASHIAWGRGAALLFVAGATLGPLLDGIHGMVHLLSYDSLPLELGGLHSSLWVPLLLGVFYAVAGSLQVRCSSVSCRVLYAASSSHKHAQVLLDEAALEVGAEPQQGLLGTLASIAQQLLGLQTEGNVTRTQEALQQRAQPPAVALATGATAALLALSAVLYREHVPYPVITVVLAAAAAANWKAFDGTRQGAFVAVLCGLAAPLSELVIIRLGLWHYQQPDLLGAQGIPSWVPFCYIFYTAPLSNLARLILKRR